MAQFCTKCGTPMGDGMTFCTTCGAVAGGAAAAPPAGVTPTTPIAAGSPVIVDAPIAPVSPAPGVPAAAPGAKKGSPVMKIVLIVVGVIIFIMVALGASCVYMVYKGKQKLHQFEKQVQTNFPSSMGTREVQPQIHSANPDAGNPGGENPSAENPGAGPAVDMADLAYPGGTPGQGANQSIFGAAGYKMQEYTTSDTVDAVVTYYKSKLGNNAMVTQTGGGAVMQVAGHAAITTINVAPDSSSGKTKIVISSFHKQ